jgi:hypothetical protein
MVRSITSLSVAAVMLLAATTTLGATPEVSGDQEDATAWVQAVLPPPADPSLSAALAVGIAAGPGSYVAAGQRTCKLVREERSKCWAQTWTSPDGFTWTPVDPLTAGLELGVMVPTLSGPEVGLQGVAHGPGGFVAFGRATPRGTSRQVTAVWRSTDGATWQRVASGDTFPAGTRLRTILGAGDGYLLGGVIYGRRAPRAAIWWSSDGVSWRRASGGDAYEIGGYIDTMEDPGAGGINGFTVYPAPIDGAGSALAGGAVAVGQACSGPADRSIFAWNGVCWGDVWRSPDGRSWERGSEGAQTRGPATMVAALGERIVTDAPICYGDGCSSAILASDDTMDWDVAYGSPVNGDLRALVAADGRFFALLMTPSSDEGSSSLRLWISDDGSDWSLASAQPTLPIELGYAHHVAMVSTGDRLLVTVSGETEPDGDLSSMALLSPPVESLA